MEAKLSKFENILDDQLHADLLDRSMAYLTDPGTSKYSSWTNLKWDFSIVQDSAPVLIFGMKPTHIPMVDIEDELVHRLVSSIDQRSGLKLKPDSSIMMYHWTSCSHIPWHDDHHVNQAMTIYLNDFWNPNWGGAFLYKKPPTDEICAVYPEPKLAVLQEGNVPHHVCPTSKGAPIRISIQIFNDDKKIY